MKEEVDSRPKISDMTESGNPSEHKKINTTEEKEHLSQCLQ